MMIAEIGLLPGAEVDRSVLDQVKAPGSGLSRYDVLPDRIILYRWPSGRKLHMSYVFRPRYGIRARSAPSILYDYYNPEAQVIVPPIDFVISGK